MLNTYLIQHRIHTLSQPYIGFESGNPSFEINGLKFSQWDFNFGEGHKTEFWLAAKTIEANDFRAAFSQFKKEINPIASQVSFLSQCYTEHLSEPYIVHKKDSDIAFVRYTRKRNGVPLAFDADSLQALKKLQERQDVNAEFFYYWNDMLNVTGYSAKLLLMCSALEALAKSSINKKSKFDFLVEVLGQELKDKIWLGDNAVRHRLIHGDYFDESKEHGDYLGQVYTKIIEYFNSKIFEESLIRNVTNPQRHPEGNKEGGYYFLRRTAESPQFELKSIVAGYDTDFYEYMDKFELLFEEDIEHKY